MNRITLAKLFELYYDVFKNFSFDLLKESDDRIGYYVFEVTDIDIGYCSKRILTKFLDEGLIDEIIFEKSSILLKEFRRIVDTDSLRNIEAVKNATKWREHKNKDN